MNHPVIASIGKDHYETKMRFGKHELIADEPEHIGGTDKGPSAGTYLKMSLAACTAITLRMYADRKGWEVEEFIVKVDYHQQDGVTHFERRIEVRGHLDDKQRKRMLQIANLCPIHKTLSGPIEIETQLAG